MQGTICGIFKTHEICSGAKVAKRNDQYPWQPCTHRYCGPYQGRNRHLIDICTVMRWQSEQDGSTWSLLVTGQHFKWHKTDWTVPRDPTAPASSTELLFQFSPVQQQSNRSHREWAPTDTLSPSLQTKKRSSEFNRTLRILRETDQASSIKVKWGIRAIFLTLQAKVGSLPGLSGSLPQTLRFMLPVENCPISSSYHGVTNSEMCSG